MADIFELFKKISSENTAPSGPITHVVVGLGNPGAEYLHTRHNAGFLAIDYICNKYNARVNKSAHKALVGEATIGGKRVLLVKPQTFMNNSGVAVRAMMDFYKIPLENLTVIHDDMDITVGDCRIKIGGGSAGHNGIRSIDMHAGREYRRIRIGVGHPRDFEMHIDPADWVLGKFSPDHMDKITAVISGIGDKITSI